MLSGDRQDVAETVAAALGVDSVLADRSPQDKVDAVRVERAEGVTVMVGDGLNDAPALAAADVGVAMGARGAGAASEAADVVLLVDRLDLLAVAIRVSRRARHIALQSVLAGIVLSTSGMIAAAAGLPAAGRGGDAAGADRRRGNPERAARAGRWRACRQDPAGAEVRALIAEHGSLGPVLDRMRRLADRLGTVGDGPRAQELVSLDVDLQRVLAHERATRQNSPRDRRLVGGADPFSAISRTHREIAHLGGASRRLVADVPARPAQPARTHGAAQTLYALEAILRLHFAQEDEIYESVGRASAP